MIKRFFRYIFRHRIVTTMILFLIGLLLIFVPGVWWYLKGSFRDAELSMLEAFYFLSQIVAAIVTIAGVIIAGWQYYITSKAEITQINIAQVQKAIDLSEYYKDNILKLYAPLRYVYESSGILKILDTADKRKYKNFDAAEIDIIFTKDSINKLKDIVRTKEFCQAVLAADQIYNLGFIKKGEIISFEKNNITINLNTMDIVGQFMQNNVELLLNNMEYFSMNFAHRTADETVVYQSLHQTYIEIVQLLYYSIAKLNVPMQTKYYTNVIELYNIWYERMQKQLGELVSNSRDIANKGTTIGDI